MSPRTGRPTDNPKPYKITVRIDEKGKQILDKFCEQKNVNQNEAIRRGFYAWKKKLKNKKTEHRNMADNQYVSMFCTRQSKLYLKSILHQIGTS